MREQKNVQSLPEADISYKELFELSPDILLIHDLEGNIIEANDAAVRSTGYSKTELEHMNLSQLSERYLDFREEFLEEVKNKEYMEFQSSHKRKDGSVYFIEAHVKVVTYNGEKVAIAVDRDITDKLQREALSSAQREVREYVGSTLDLDQIMKVVVTKAAMTIGAESAAVVLKEKDNWTIRYVHGLPRILIGSRFEVKDIPKMESLISKRETVVINGNVSQFSSGGAKTRLSEFKSLLGIPLVVRGDLCGFMVFQHIASPLGFSGDQIEFINNLAPAISLAVENSRLFKETKQAADRLSLILNTVGEGILVTDFNGSLVFVNDSAQRILGIRRSKMVGKRYYEIGFRLMREDESMSSAKISDAKMAESLRSSVKDLEMRFMRPDGSILYLLVNAQPLIIKKREFEGSVISFKDITQRRMNEERLVKERDLMTLVMETSPAGILLIDRGGRIVLSNRRAQYLLGLSKDVLIGLQHNDPLLNISDFEGEPIPDMALPFSIVLHTGEPVYNQALSFETPGRSRFFLNCNAGPIFNEKGEVDRVVVTIEDVTERVEVQTALDESMTTSRDIVDGIPIGITIYRFEPPDQLFLQSANPSASIVLHTNLSKEVGKEYGDVWGQDVVGELKGRILRSIRSGRAARLDELTIEGPRMSGSFSVSIFRLPGDRVCVTFEDITRQMMEEELRRRAHMQIEQNIEHFATLVDQIRNPLSVIIAISDMSSCKDRDRIKHQAESIEAILKQLDKGWMESDKIRAFLRKYI